MIHQVLKCVCVAGAVLLASTAGARGPVAPPTGEGVAPKVNLRPVKPLLQLRAAPERKQQPAQVQERQARPWSQRFASVRRAMRQAPRKLLQRLRGASRPVAARPTPCSSGACPAASRVGPTHAGAQVRVVARVRPLTRAVYIRRSRQVLARLRGGERVAAFRMLASRRVRSSAAAQHVVLNYLQLRGMSGGQALPLSMSDFGTMVRARGWSSRRMANFALVLRQASVIARREGIGAKRAFDKALKMNGIYKKYYSGRCGA